jgi:hypothetical protein
LEQTVSTLKIEQLREKESVNRVEVTTLRNSEEFKSMLNQFNGEFSHRLEIKLTDFV